MNPEGFNFDFSRLTMLYLKSIFVDFNEIKSVFNEDAKVFEKDDEHYQLIGMSEKSKFLNVNFVFTGQELNFMISILDVQLSHKEHVKEYWCKKR